MLVLVFFVTLVKRWSRGFYWDFRVNQVEVEVEVEFLGERDGCVMSVGENFHHTDWLF